MTQDELTMLDELLGDDSDRLSEWEVNFLESMDRKRVQASSDRERHKLEQIWEKLFGGAKSN